MKSAEQQAVLMLHRTRDRLVRQRTQLINAMRAHMAEFVLVAARGRDGRNGLIALVRGEVNRLPDRARKALQVILSQLDALQLQIGDVERHIYAQHRSSEASTLPGLGILRDAGVWGALAQRDDRLTERPKVH